VKKVFIQGKQFIRLFVFYRLFAFCYRHKLFLGKSDGNLTSLLMRECLDVYNYSFLNVGNYEQYVKFNGLEHLLACKDRPVIFYTAHVGRFVLPLVALAKIHREHGCVINGPGGVPFAEHLFRRKKLKLMEKYMGGPFFYTGSSMYRLYKHLTRSGMVVLLVDIAAPQNTKSASRVSFMGKKIHLHNTLIRLALKTKASLVPFVATDPVDKMYPISCKINEAVRIDESASMEDNLSLALAPIEEILYSNLEQWWARESF
jgi:lauroyl/myristoyl acyltransferase